MMTSERSVCADANRHPSRRTTLKLVAGAGLVGTGVSRPRPARAANKVRVLTYFFAEPTQSGFFQAAATGLYEKAGLDVEIKQGGPQLNGMMLLAGGETDIFMGSGIAVLNSIDRNIPVIAVAAPLQFDLQVIVTRPDVNAIEDLKGRKILVTAGGRAGYWHWLKARYGFTEDQVAPYTGNFQPFVQDPTIALGGIATSEPYRVRQAGVDVKYFLLAKYGYPPYGGPLVAMQSFVANNRDVMARFVHATLEGWKSFWANPAPALALIQRENPQADDGWMAYSVATMKELNVIGGGDAATAGLGIMSEDRWRQLAEFMVQVQMIKPTTDWRSAYTNEFVKELRITL
jgi:NitT/TauT family transport system substrate-binding protein